MSENRTQKLTFPKSGNNIPVRTVVAGAIVMLAIGFALGTAFAVYGNSSAGLNDPPEGVDFAPVWKAWHLIDEKFVPAAVATSTRLASSTEEANQERVWGMIQGLAESLGDPYTFFLPPKENEIFTEDISGAFEGVGMEIAIRDQVLTIVSPLKDTPAERAGLKSGDLILEIDGKDTEGLDISTAVSYIRGPRGTHVTLLIMRDGFSEPREFDVVRDVIDLPTVVTTHRPDDVFVIELLSFSANSTGLFRQALREFVESGSRDLVLDLRGNPGGYLEAAVDIGSWFLPTGRVIVTEDYAENSSNIVHRSRGYDVFNENLRMAILVDRGSASASEILAGALRHYGVAIMVGDNTFGKGSVQELVDITSDTALKITVARWLGPDGEQIPIEGIEPDIKVEYTEEDIEAGEDPQLEAAIKALRAEE